MSPEERYDLQKGLIDFNYGYISIDATFTYLQLKKAEYKAQGIQNIVSVLMNKETNIQSLGAVLADLFFILMLDKSIEGAAKVKIFADIIREAAPSHDLAQLEENIFINLQNRVRPERHDKLHEMIRFVFLSAVIKST